MTFRVSIKPQSGGHAGDSETRWLNEDLVARIWRGDPTVWADPPAPEIASRLGWLHAPERSRKLVTLIEELHRTAVNDGITDVVLCGMGGSSLAPEVFASTLPSADGSPRLTVMDSTHPDAVRAVDAAIDPATTWFIISSKSGGTIETMSLLKFFWERATLEVPDPGNHFIAITDPGTSLETLAAEKGFRATVLADPEVGGRYSALTAFGLVPAGIIGADVGALLDAAKRGAARCGPDIPLEENAGFGIGVRLTDRSRRNSDKVRFVSSPPVASLGIWIEQLIAESTGKDGVGIVPIDGGPRLDGVPGDNAGATTVGIGTPTDETFDIEISLHDPYDVGTVMFILEFATAVAGEILGVNPFDQPDVEIAKQLAGKAMQGDAGAAEAAPHDVHDPRWVRDFLAALGETTPPSYVSIQAYLPQDADTEERLDTLRLTISTTLGVYTTTGYGPRYLHSTGQLHKGGPPGGVFLQIVDDTATELMVPGAGYTFNQLIQAQAAGDRAALADRGRSVISVNVGGSRVQGLRSLVDQVRAAVQRTSL